LGVVSAFVAVAVSVEQVGVVGAAGVAVGIAVVNGLVVATVVLVEQKSNFEKCNNNGDRPRPPSKKNLYRPHSVEGNRCVILFVPLLRRSSASREY